MKPPIKIGTIEFKYKKDALLYFKKILNTYDYGQLLNINDFNDVCKLLETHKKAKEKIGVGIKEIRVDKITYKTKCFQIIRNDLSSDFFSYIKCINGSTPPFTKFSKVCRETVNDDMREVKLSYFKKNSKKGRVKCQETGKLCLWDELSVDHRQPNTFSMIVDRFIEINKIDLKKVEYVEKEIYGSRFKDDFLADSFRKYHKEKANLRIVLKENNLGRSYQGRVKTQKKDLRIEKNDND